MRTSIVIAALFAAAAAGATTYTVTTTADSGAGSLRQAITDANGNGGADVINFNIVGAGVHTITPATPLPPITDAVTIDGYSQPGASANSNAPDQGSNAVLLIEINGQNLMGFGGQALDVTATGVAIRGLVINRCQNSAIRALAGGNGTIIAGNFLGTDASGSSRPGAQNQGVELNGGTGAVIGGPNPADRNVIAGNDGADIVLNDSGGSNAVIQGNLIGTNAAGAAGHPRAVQRTRDLHSRRDRSHHRRAHAGPSECHLGSTQLGDRHRLHGQLDGGAGHDPRQLHRHRRHGNSASG